MTPSPDIPTALDTPEFRKAWDEWRQHRAELKKKLTPTAMNRQLSRLTTMGVARAIAAIEHSVANGWQGIFEPPGTNARRGQSTYTDTPRESLADKFARAAEEQG